MNAEAEVDLEAAQKRLAAMNLHNNGAPASPAQTQSTSNAPEARKRKQRSDAGRPKPPKPPAAAPGVLTEQQWARMNVYVERITQSAVDLSSARAKHDRLLAEAHDFFDSLKRTGEGKGA